MRNVTDLLYNAFPEVPKDEKLLLDIDFMMNILSALYEGLPEFKNYLEYSFEQKKPCIIGLSKLTDCILGIDEAMVELFVIT